MRSDIAWSSVSAGANTEFDILFLKNRFSVRMGLRLARLGRGHAGKGGLAAAEKNAYETKMRAKALTRLDSRDVIVAAGACISRI
jgi:hypothetical protein